MDFLIELYDVCYQNEGKDILKNITIQIKPGDYISITGPSGSGKSTLLKLCSHLISARQGKILFRGRCYTEYDPTGLRKSIAYCFQTPYLFSNTVMDNIQFPFSIRNQKFDQDRVHELFSLFQMPLDFLNKDVRNLSGGEKQRIALIRSLLFKPEVLLLDEATSALDVDNTEIIESIITSLNKDGVTILWVTHNIEQSKRHANRRLHMEGGKIKALEDIR